MENKNTKKIIASGIIAFFIFFVLVLNLSEKTIKITQEKYPDNWAFSVNELTLKCKKEMVTALDPSGQLYYLNGLAKGKYYGNPDYKDISTIQIDDEKINNTLKALSNGQPFTPVKKDISFAVEKGLELCK